MCAKMPRKTARGRGRYNTASPTVSVTGSSSGNSSSRRAAQSSSNSSSNASSSKGSSQLVTKSGRQTKNSSGNRRKKFPNAGRRTPVPKSSTVRRGRKKDSSLQDPSHYKAEDGVVYKPGGECYHSVVKYV